MVTIRYDKDAVGNYTIKTINITNIDNEAPNIDITLNPEFNLTASLQITINYGDSSLKQYKIGELNTNWSNYSGVITLTSQQVLQNGWQNNDGTVTVYAKGRDQAGNEAIVTKTIFNLDLDIPSTPVITSNYGYPILTSYGVKVDGLTTISFDTRPGIINEYSLDNGQTWHEYTGEFEVAAGTIRARSTKIESGLQVIASKTNTMPNDAMSPEVYDGNDNTYMTNVTNKYIQVDSSMEGKKIRVRIYSTNPDFYRVYIDFLNSQRNQISTMSSSGSGYLEYFYTVPSGTKWIRYRGSVENTGSRLYEIQVSNEPTFSVTNGYMLLHADQTKVVRSPYQMVTINYFATSVTKQYRIGSSGNWQIYQGQPVKVNQGQTIYARGIDQYGNYTRVTASHTVNIPDALKAEAFDGNESTYITNVTNQFMQIDSSMEGKKIRVKIYSTNPDFYKVTINTLNSQKTVISGGGASSSGSGHQELTITIPGGAR